MKVTLLNSEQVVNMFQSWGEFAATCYNTPSKYAEKVGNKCYDDEHYSGSRTEYFKFKIEGIDRGISEQVLRHEIGVRSNPMVENTYDENPSNIVKNMKSFRYVDMKDFDYSTPTSIQKNELALKEYEDCMNYINEKRENIKNILLESGVDKRLAVEDSNYLLPRATHTSFVLALTLEALIHYMHKRLCTATQPFHRDLAKIMRDEVLSVLPQLKDRLVPHCDYLLWCPETNRCCGRHLTKEEFKNKHLKQNNK